MCIMSESAAQFSDTVSQFAKPQPTLDAEELWNAQHSLGEETAGLTQEYVSFAVQHHGRTEIST